MLRIARSIHSPIGVFVSLAAFVAAFLVSCVIPLIDHGLVSVGSVVLGLAICLTLSVVLSVIAHILKPLIKTV